MGHAGVSDTLTELRDNFWILRGRQKVKKIIGRCHGCRRYKTSPIAQEIGPLPEDRLTQDPPFSIIGIDFAGPLFVKQGKIKSKSYIVVFVCANTRALHIELVPDMTVESFLQAFRRFAGRRGIPHTIYSDNARTFKRSSKELAEIWEVISREEVQNYSSGHYITWKFLPERACWWGGFYERLIRSIKQCLRKILGRALLTFQELTTILVEVEAMLNSRPLTYISDDPRDPEILTPAHFLVGHRLTTIPEVSGYVEDRSKTPDEELLTKRIKYRQRLTEQIWRKWKNLYVLELKSAHWTPRTRRQTLEIPLEGSVVLLYDKNQPRTNWKMGIIEKRYPGRDGLTRMCEVRLTNGNIVRRPVQLICPFECPRNRP